MSQNKPSDFQKLLDSDLNYPEDLDQMWSAYLETKNIKFVLKIVSVLDWDDRTRIHLESWLQKADLSEHSEYRQRLADWVIPINYEERTIGGPLDLDLHMACMTSAPMGQI